MDPRVFPSDILLLGLVIIFYGKFEGGEGEAGRDVELSILHYLKDGGVVRFDNICAKTVYRHPVGGIASNLSSLMPGRARTRSR